ncbi:MAG: DNA recombination protein RmuC [Candidatus Spechtbacterales bacterium]
MSDTLYIAVIAVLAVVVAVALLRRERTKSGPKEDSSLVMLQNQMSQMARTLDEKLGSSERSMQEAVRHQFTESQKLIQSITRELTEVKETNKQVFGMTEQLHSLEQVLKNQKQRGNLGEAGLELILANMLPPDAYQMQYAFNDGTIVDAILKTRDGLIPVDAKFSLENYVRIAEEKDDERRLQLEKDFKNDLKRRIDETSKYIKPKEGTLPFAFMYIPAEGIYYDLLVNEVGAVQVNTRDLIDYAQKERGVIIVSPTTFSAYLHTVLLGFRNMQIEKSAELIGKRVEELGRHIRSYDSYMQKLGNSLGTTVSHYNTAYKELKKVDKDVVRITAAAPEVEAMEPGIEPLQLERPQTDDEED